MQGIHNINQTTLLLNSALVATDPQSLSLCRSLLQQDMGFFVSVYPKFEEWFDRKVVPGLILGQRTILIELRQEHVAGFLIVKDSPLEKKICTLRVREEFQDRGLGVRLFKRAFELLKTEEPLLSASQHQLPRFTRIFDYFGFRIEREYIGLYRPLISEFSFNGLLKYSGSSAESVDELRFG
ncbi:MAG: hypothetical protein ACREYC_09260 [Gammaproteobacteria bacterium]